MPLSRFDTTLGKRRSVSPQDLTVYTNFETFTKPKINTPDPAARLFTTGADGSIHPSDSMKTFLASQFTWYQSPTEPNPATPSSPAPPPVRSDHPCVRSSSLLHPTTIPAASGPIPSPFCVVRPPPARFSNIPDPDPAPLLDFPAPDPALLLGFPAPDQDLTPLFAFPAPDLAPLLDFPTLDPDPTPLLDFLNLDPVPLLDFSIFQIQI
ncbi:uncharacterized protein LOC131232399 [Magnolia sinica]|uniref:uncharacterized protein LOC131232399 n=1 Tax=Magnolia sinica TaxID=86752 RepID=UPI0026585478|nr:uncharacterized protein LOC131232399 [Magnolia sinica]